MDSSSKQNWQLGDAGILRKKEEDEELLVFGYSCKLFRDDEKALYIDQGKHLIPWMGDDTLKIDRYDGRGALYDLKQYEPLPGGYDESLWVGLSDSERHVEHLCNEERYRALHHNEDEEALYQEEELKRLHQALDNKTYGEVAFDYDQEFQQTKPGCEGEVNDKETEDGDEPFRAPPELDIPVNMALPENVKLNAIIEKTALFINSQGPQMEILLKMKQASNPQFEFLSYTSPLHPYYRHLQMAIKTGRYQPKVEEQQTDTKKTEEDVEEEDHYLHPSLAPSSQKVELAPLIPSIAYKPSANCTYSMLVNRIKDKQAAFSGQPPVTADVTPQPAPQAVQTVAVVKPTPLVIEATPVLYKSSSSAEKETTKSTSTTISTIGTAQVSSAASDVPKKVFTPVVNMPKAAESVEMSMTYAPVDSAALSSQATTANGVSSHTPPVPTFSFLMPPADVQLIVDKMASYVAKNGREFETIVRNKSDPRFAFLDVKHQYYPYYLHKVDMYEQMEKPKSIPQIVTAPAVERKKEESEESSDSEEAENSREGSQKSDGSADDKQSSSTKPVVAPVCFSIKKPKEADVPLDKKSALPLEESTDEEGENKEGSGDVKATEAAAVKHEEEVIDLTEEAMAIATEETSEKYKEKKEKRKDRPAEEKVKDKLAAAAREKVAAKARERQLQLERKRRAAAFLTMIQKAPGESPILSTQSQDGSRVSGEDDVSSVPSSISSGSESPERNLEVEDRLNADGKSSSLLSRIQGGTEGLKRHRRSSSSDSDYPKVKKKTKSKEKKKKSSHKSERTPSRSHKHRKEDHGKHRREDDSRYHREDDQRKSRKAKKHRSKSPKGHRSSRSYHNLDRSSSKSKTSRDRRSKKKQKKEKKSSSSDVSS